MFYTTVAGWMISYFFKMLKGDFVNKTPQQVENIFGNMLADPKVLIFWMLVVIALGFLAVSYTHLTLPTKRIVKISVGAASLKKKQK